MSASTTRIVATGLLMAAILAISACASSSSSPGAHLSSGAAVASSALANPTVSADLTAEETLLLNNLKNNLDPAHPFQSVRTAVKLTFPKGNIVKIEDYAIKTFTLAVLHSKGPGSARDIWLQGVVTYAQSTQGQGASSPPTTPAPASSGQASIPGA